MRKIIPLFVLMLTALTWTAYAGQDSNLPVWARTGHWRIDDWYGGPIETAKGFLSGWPSFFDADPMVVYAETTRYDPQRVDLIERARFNWVAVVWSAGFSDQSERVQQDLLRPFIAECHRRGIRVMAYLSIANIFAEDMFAHVPESRTWVIRKDGQPVSYSAADYQKVGRVTRYMADLRNKGWQEQTLQRALSAVDAGIDSLNFDNNFPELYGLELMGQFKARVLAEGRKRHPDLIVNSNYHASAYLLARCENSVNTEDGREPGIFPSPAGHDAGLQENRTETPAIPVKGGGLILNAGLLRILNAVSEGWRPIVVAHSQQYVGTLMSAVLPPAHQKLVLAECQAFQAANENFQDGKPYSDLFYGDKKGGENWEAIRLYNTFFDQYESLYSSPISLARIAVIINPESEQHDLALLNRLAARNVIYDAVYEQDALPAKLSPYAVIIAAPSVALRPGWRRYENVRPAEIAAASPVTMAAPDSVVLNAHGQANTQHVLVHLLNYGDTPVSGIEVSVRGQFKGGQLLSPDMVNTNIQIRPAGKFTQILIHELKTYDLLVL